VMIYTGILGTTTWSRTHGMAAWTKCCLFVCHDGTDAWFSQYWCEFKKQN
jgi:hypothetical protein